MTQLPDTNAIERLHGVTYSHLVELEPRLEPLLWEARKVGALMEVAGPTLKAFRPPTQAVTPRAELGRDKLEKWPNSCKTSKP
jgi:hypothetical protein